MCFKINPKSPLNSAFLVIFSHFLRPDTARKKSIYGGYLGHFHISSWGGHFSFGCFFFWFSRSQQKTRPCGLVGISGCDIQKLQKILRGFKKNSVKKVENFGSKIDFEILDRKLFSEKNELFCHEKSKFFQYKNQ